MIIHVSESRDIVGSYQEMVYPQFREEMIWSARYRMRVTLCYTRQSVVSDWVHRKGKSLPHSHTIL